MRKMVVMVALLTLCLANVFAVGAALERADSLFWLDRLEETKQLLLNTLDAATTDTQRAEVLWRLSRATLSIGDERKEEGAGDAELFAIYEEAEQYALDALAYGDHPNAIVYKASSIGRWGETKGPLNALSKARPMRDDFTYLIDTLGVTDNTISWYVLGQLYYQLPGWPLSFGNLDTAISYTRKAIETIPPTILYPGHFKALAEMLWKRNNNVSKRTSNLRSMERDWNKASGKSTLDQHAYYEGANGPSAVPFYSPVALNRMSDRQEAVMLLQFALAKYDVWHFHSRGDKRSRVEIEALLKDWGF